MRHYLLILCTVAFLFAATASAVTAAPAASPAECVIDFENLAGAYPGMPVAGLHIAALKLTFSTSKPGGCFPIIGDWDAAPQGGGWSCAQLGGAEDVVLPSYSYQGGTWFLTWANCEPHLYTATFEFSADIEALEGDILDIDDPGHERMEMQGFDINGTAIPGAQDAVYYNDPDAGDCSVAHWRVTGTGIRKVVFTGAKPTGGGQTVGFGVDNLKVTYWKYGDTSYVIPTLSEWSAIIFATLLLGSVVLYIWRRRRTTAA